MGWTLDEVLDLPAHYYDVLIDELNKDAARQTRPRRR